MASIFSPRARNAAILEIDEMMTTARPRNDDIVAVQCNLDRIEAQLDFLRATLIELLGEETGFGRPDADQPHPRYV
jgi:hypothetical protein